MHAISKMNFSPEGPSTPVCWHKVPKAMVGIVFEAWHLDIRELEPFGIVILLILGACLLQEA